VSEQQLVLQTFRYAEPTMSFDWHLDWPSLIIGTLLSIPAALFSNYLYKWLDRYLEKRKTIITIQKNETALLEYVMVRQFKEGRLDITIYMMSRLSLIPIFAATAGIAFTSVCILLNLVSADQLRPGVAGAFPKWLIPPAFILTLCTGVTSILLALRLYRDVMRIVGYYLNFRTYKERLEKIFGPLDDLTKRNDESESL
jgi:hypothetical protein